VGYEWLVTLVLALHFSYVAYVVVGGFLAWRWPRAIWPHLVACAWAVLIVASVVNCPLTATEAWARELAGQGPMTVGFVDRYLENVIYPGRYVALAQAAVALVVAISWIGAYRRRRGSGQRANREAQPTRP
jgi:hypothetical protein